MSRGDLVSQTAFFLGSLGVAYVVVSGADYLFFGNELWGISRLLVAASISTAGWMTIASTRARSRYWYAARLSLALTLLLGAGVMFSSGPTRSLLLTPSFIEVSVDFPIAVFVGELLLWSMIGGMAWAIATGFRRSLREYLLVGAGTLAACILANLVLNPMRYRGVLEAAGMLRAEAGHLSGVHYPWDFILLGYAVGTMIVVIVAALRSEKSVET
jgi:hypothetical protein